MSGAYKTTEYVLPGMLTRTPEQMGFETRTAWEIAGEPDLFNRTWRFSIAGREYECLGTTPSERVKFGRLDERGGTLREVVRYADPDAKMIAGEARA